MEETITHWSHKWSQHRLKSMVVEEKKSIMCGLCEEPISNGSTAFGCIESCDYFMHKTCTQVQDTIVHPLHPQHDLGFYECRDDTCDLCGVHMRYAFLCFRCAWLVCKKCGLFAVTFKDEIDVKIKHEGHPHHTLSLQFIPATFCCDACRTDGRDWLYRCNDCSFWIHKKCANLAHKIHLPHHHPDHPLLLAYQLHERFLGYWFKCEFCNIRIKRTSWLYHCPRCRYFVHVKCALEPPSHGTSSSSGAQTNYDDGVLHFPRSEALTEPLKLLTANEEAANDGATTKKEMNDHWSHPHHPLMLVDTSTS